MLHSYVSTFRVAWVGLTLLLALASGSPTQAQCVSDNLDSVPCCTPVSPVLPTFPAISQSAKYVCFRDCGVPVDQNLCVDIDPPIPANSGGPVCGVYLIGFKIKTCGSGQILWRGTMRAHYSRNWDSTAASGLQVGVWRFFLNGDLKATPFLQSLPQWSSPNVGPACYASYNAIYVSGYIDYALDCGSSTWEASWCFRHECDGIHHPLGSPRPAPVGGYHPTRSFVFLGPGAGFVVDPATTLTANGPVTAEAMRENDWSALPNICRAEEAASGQLSLIGSSCACSNLPGATAQYDETFLAVNGACGASALTLVPAIRPLYQQRIGQWTTAAVFPGNQDLCLVTGDIEYRSSCTSLQTNEFFEGVVTVGGYFAVSYGGVVLDRVFMDLASSNRNPNNLSPRIGVPNVARYVLNCNLP